MCVEMKEECLISMVVMVLIYFFLTGTLENGIKTLRRG